ncbi:TPA: 30S ribosomal protein S17 [Patescibacteria group bacterium]|nr:30S ribosomal protein S17 [Patescibacteria group bacterium]
MNKSKQTKSGKVVSAQMMATVVVSVDSFVSHPLYHKKIRKTRRFLAHNPADKAKLGDWVTIEETRPISKLKRWVVVDIKSPVSMVDVNADIAAIDQTVNEVI